jgi:hypothetical protein
MSTRRRSSVLNYVKDSILQRLGITRKVRTPVTSSTSSTSSTRRVKSRLSQTSRIHTKEVTPSPIRKGVAIIKPLLAKSRIARTLKKKIKQRALSKFLDNDPACAICLMDIQDINEGTRTSCNHIFHKTCLAQWLVLPISRNTCPECRRDIIKQSNLIESGLVLSQIEELRAETQNISPTMRAILITKLHDSHKIMKTHIEIIKWICNNHPQLQGEITASLCQQITQFEEICSLLKKTIDLFIDVFPSISQIYYDLKPNEDEYNLYRLTLRLQKMTKNNIIAEFLQSNNAYRKANTELLEYKELKLFITVASLYIDNQLSS